MTENKTKDYVGLNRKATHVDQVGQVADAINRLHVLVEDGILAEQTTRNQDYDGLQTQVTSDLLAEKEARERSYSLFEEGLGKRVETDAYNKDREQDRDQYVQDKNDDLAFRGAVLNTLGKIAQRFGDKEALDAVDTLKTYLESGDTRNGKKSKRSKK